MEILSALIMGTVYVVAPGPIGIETLRQGTRGGFVAALAVQGGSALGRFLYAALALLGAEVFLRHAAWQPLAGVGGMALLVYLGITTIREGREMALVPSVGDACACSARRALGSGAMLSLANPLDVLFWLSIGGSLLQEPGRQEKAFLLAFAAGCVAASLLLALFAAFWQSRLTGRAARALSWVCGLALVGFGLHLGLMAVATLAR